MRFGNRASTIFILLALGLEASWGAGMNGRRGASKIEDHPHNDASTGTITHLTDDQVASSHAAMTCDEIMAKSVVLANEQKVKAESQLGETLAQLTTLQAEHATLLKDFATTKETLTSTIETLNANLSALREETDTELTKVRDEAAKKIEEMESQMAKVKVDADETVASIKTEWEDKLSEEKKRGAAAIKEMEATIESVKTSSAALVATEKTQCQESAEQLMKEHSDRVVAIEKASQEALVASESARDEKIAHLTLTITEMEANHTSFVDALQVDKESHVNKLDAECKASIVGLKELHEEEKTSLQVSMAEKELKTKKELEAVNAELNGQIGLLRQTSQKELTEASTRHEKEKSELEASILALQQKEKQMVDDLEAVQVRLDSVTQELVEWEAKHDARSYCNITHIHEDTKSAVVAASKVAGDHVYYASKVATEHVSKAAEPHLKKGKELYDAHLKDHVDKHYETGRQLYESHLKEHVDKHILPLHDSHVIPGVQYVHDKYVETTDAAFAYLVRGYTGACNGVKQGVDGWVLGVVESSCKDPEEQVELLLWALLVLTLFLLRRHIYRAIVRLIWLPFKAAYYMSPLPLFFRKKKAQAEAFIHELTHHHESTENGNGPVKAELLKPGPSQ